jgi:hypothetical protein
VESVRGRRRRPPVSSEVPNKVLSDPLMFPNKFLSAPPSPRARAATTAPEIGALRRASQALMCCAALRNTRGRFQFSASPPPVRPHKIATFSLMFVLLRNAPPQAFPPRRMMRRSSLKATAARVHACWCVFVAVLLPQGILCVLITAVPIIKLFAWGGRGIEEDCGSGSVSGSGEEKNLITCIRLPLPCPPGLTGTGHYCVVGPAASVRRAARQSSTQPAEDPPVPSRRRRRRRRRSRGGRRARRVIGV